MEQFGVFLFLKRNDLKETVEYFVDIKIDDTDIPQIE